MSYIPTLNKVQLEILRLAKQRSGKAVILSLETAMISEDKPPSRNPKLFQKLIDLGLVEVHFKHVFQEKSRWQMDSWASYCDDLELPSIRAWELWRQAFIAEQEDMDCALIPGEGFEEFSDVWVEEIRFQATQAC